jgi:hypothetical protein
VLAAANAEGGGGDSGWAVAGAPLVLWPPARDAAGLRQGWGGSAEESGTTLAGGPGFRIG